MPCSARARPLPVQQWGPLGWRPQLRRGWSRVRVPHTTRLSSNRGAPVFSVERSATAYEHCLMSTHSETTSTIRVTIKYARALTQSSTTSPLFHAAVKSRHAAHDH